jgi:DNA polymerase III alpha subunit
MQATRGNLEVQLHNANCPHDPVVLAGAAPVQLSFGWNLPREYLDLTLDQLHDVLLEQVERDDLYQARIARLSEEIALFRTNGALPVLQAICYVLDSFRAAGQLWGVGRGSSCASYVLYLLGLHSVDSVKWEIPIDEFIHE